MVGRLATLHFAPTETPRANLLAEGCADESIHVTGNTVIDALLNVVEKNKTYATRPHILREQGITDDISDVVDMI